MASPTSEFEGVYVPEPLESVRDLGQLVEYLQRQLQRISAVSTAGKAGFIKFVNVPPTKPREGLTTGADGTNWNPGAGKGVYTYYSGVWNKLG